eukprot:scaffold7340_cov266-Pinguiococcus_pyrenoidosus.AAC.74
MPRSFSSARTCELFEAQEVASKNVLGVRSRVHARDLIGSIPGTPRHKVYTPVLRDGSQDVTSLRLPCARSRLGEQRSRCDGDKRPKLLLRRTAHCGAVAASVLALLVLGRQDDDHCRQQWTRVQHHDLAQGSAKKASRELPSNLVLKTVQSGPHQLAGALGQVHSVGDKHLCRTHAHHGH